MAITAVFTVLPNGVSPSGKLRLSVFMTPWADGIGVPATIAGTIFQDWPSQLRNRTFQVEWEFGVRPAVLDALPPGIDSRFDSALWQRMFPATTPLRPTEQKSFVDSGISSYDAAVVSREIKSTYREVAGNGGAKHVVTQAATNKLSRAVLASAAATRFRDNVKAALVDSTGSPRLSKVVARRFVGEASTPEQSLATEVLRALVLYQSEEEKEQQLSERQAAAAATPPELKDLLAALGTHPWLLRRLGVVFDLLIDPEGLAVSDPNAALIPVAERHHLRLVSFPLGAEMAKVPLTTVVRWSQDFQAYTDDPELSRHGFLRPDAYHVEEMDLDHAAVEFGAFAERTASKLAQASEGSVEVGLPALQTVGLSLHEKDREAKTGARFSRSDPLQSDPSTANFVMGELIRGYRVDVNRNGQGWRSLCERLDAVLVGSEVLRPNGPDEGHVSAGSMSVSDAGPSLTRLAESLFHWSGWSLIAPPPAPENHAPCPAPFLSKSRVNPGSLPRLRFNDTYQLRVRLVDLAGNDLAHTIGGRPADEYVMPLGKKFRRYEPITSPTLVLQNEVTEGESLERLVIRSNPYGFPARDPYAYADAVQPSVGGSYHGNCIRHVAPPKISYALAELHGKFDGTLPGSGSPTERAFKIARKEEGSFVDTAVTDSSTGEYQGVQTGREIITPAGARNADGQYVVHRKESSEIVLPYLPDPNAKSFVLRGFGSPIARELTERSGKSWPEISLFALELKGSSDGRTTITGAGTPGNAVPLSVSLPPGGILHLTYSCGARDGSVMALCDDATSQQAALDGQSAVATPSRKISFIHAVQQPMPPVLNEGDLSTPERSAGSTRQSVRAGFRVDGKTTDRVEVVARWAEQADATADLDDDPGVPTPQTGIVASVQVAYDAMSVVLPDTAVQAFGDTKRRDVEYQAVATTRFRECFPPSLCENAENISSRSGVVRRTIRSTARPPSPRVVCTLPTFKWSDSTSGGTVTRTRTGRGLRVYVERPWYATGNDERLGIVLAQTEQFMLDNPGLVSVWGDDTAWVDRGKLNPMSIQSVIAPAVVEQPGVLKSPSTLRDVALAENGKPVDIVMAEPVFNRERDEWYFDFELAALTTYMPFVRLALARVQPESLVDLRLSKVVLADFAQLMPDRVLELVPAGSRNYDMTLSGVVDVPAEWAEKTADTRASRPAPEAAPGHYVEAVVQESIDSRGETADWVDMSGAVMPLDANIAPAKSGAARLSFQGRIGLPSAARAGRRYRVLVNEYEAHPGSADSSQNGARRLVYSDSIEVPV